LGAIENEKTVWENGEFLDDRMDEDGVHRVALYQIFSFYVELFYHIEYNVLSKLIAFSDTEMLDVYLQQYSLDELTGR
jgi:hypothetical protein